MVFLVSFPRKRESRRRPCGIRELLKRNIDSCFPAYRRQAQERQEGCLNEYEVR